MSPFIIACKFMETLRDLGVITEEQYIRTAEIVITAKAGEAVVMEHRTFLTDEQCERIAKGIEIAKDAKAAGLP